MSSMYYIDSLDKLRPFLNEKNVLEVAMRDANKQFAPFVNVVLTDTQSDQKELGERVVRRLCDSVQDNQQTLETLANRAQILEGLGNASIILNALNLCATCAGFAVMYRKMNQMSSQINQQLMRLDETVRKSFDIERKFKLDQVLSDHSDMLNSIKLQRPYSEGKMRELVDSEYQMTELLINTLEADVSNDQSALITSLFSLMAMFTVSLCKFDELYYFNNPQIHGHEDPWHTSHENWTSVYDDMLSERFAEVLQDYGIFELGLGTWETDGFYGSMLAQVIDAKTEVEDNQALVVAFETKGALQRYRDLTRQSVINIIRTAFRDSADDMDQHEIEAMCEEALQQAAMV